MDTISSKRIRTTFGGQKLLTPTPTPAAHPDTISVVASSSCVISREGPVARASHGDKGCG